MKNMKVCIGGTFDILHKGHKKLIDKAFETAGKNGFVFIGITKQKMVKNKNITNNLDVRKKKLELFISKSNYVSSYKIKPIDDIYGPTIEEDFDAIVVSPESIKNGEKINFKRKETGKKPLEIIKIPYVLSEDKKPISTTRIKKGEVDLEGKITKD